MADKSQTSTSASFDGDAFRAALADQDYDTVIEAARTAMLADPMGALADPSINDWIGRRFRNIFISEAVADPSTVKASQATFPLNLVDQRDEREQVAQRMIRGIDVAEIHVEMPRAKASGLTNTTLIFAPGLLTGLLPSLAFQYIWPGITERFGLRVLASDSHPMRSSDLNVADLENAIERGIGIGTTMEAPVISAQDDPIPPGDVLLMGYSKGSPDILSLLVQRPDLAPRIRGVIGWAGAVGGSYVADDAYDKIKDMPLFAAAKGMSSTVTRQVMRLAPIAQLNQIDRRLEDYDPRGALESLTTWYRGKFLEDNSDLLNSLGIPMFYFTGSTSFLEVPYFQRQGTIQLDVYDQNNDMQLTQMQATLPLPTAPKLAMFHANHWDLSYDRFPWYTTMGSQHLKEPFARTAAMSAIVLLMAELGLLD